MEEKPLAALQQKPGRGLATRLHPIFSKLSKGIVEAPERHTIFLLGSSPPGAALYHLTTIVPLSLGSFSGREP